jgi:hypothetical protein
MEIDGIPIMDPWKTYAHCLDVLTATNRLLQYFSWIRKESLVVCETTANPS